MCNKVIISILIFLYSTDTFCQLDKYKSDYYDDSQINEMPNFITYRLNGNNIGVVNFQDFIFGLQSMVESCASKKIELIHVHSRWLWDISFLPEEFTKSGKIYIKIDEVGEVYFLNVYNTDHSNQLKECLLELLNKSQIKPAYKDNHAVKCYLQFLIK